MTGRFCSNSTYPHMLENRDKASKSPWQLECKVSARRAVLTGMAALCAACWAVWAGRVGASNHTLDPRWGNVWLRPARSAAVASLHSTESAKLHQPLLCLDMHTLTQTHIYMLIYLQFLRNIQIFSPCVPPPIQNSYTSINPSLPIPPGHNHMSSRINHVGR